MCRWRNSASKSPGLDHNLFVSVSGMRLCSGNGAFKITDREQTRVCESKREEETRGVTDGEGWERRWGDGLVECKCSGDEDGKWKGREIMREEEKRSHSQRDELVHSLQTAFSVHQSKDYIHPLLPLISHRIPKTQPQGSIHLSPITAAPFCSY